jgi:FkbM family methyltransferase
MRERFSRWFSGRRGDRLARELYVAYRERLPDRLLSAAERKDRQYDRDMLQIARSVLDEDSNFIDAGAHAGTVLKQLVKLAPRGQGYAFEPIPSLCRGLRSKFPGIVVEEIALGDHQGSAEFHYLTDDPARSSLIDRPNWEIRRTVKLLKVAVRRLDDCVPADVRIAFLKVDVEGAELALLRGARRVLTDDRPVVVFESEPKNLPEVASYLGSVGMEVSLLSRFPSGTTKETMELLPGSGEYCFVGYALNSIEPS